MGDGRCLHVPERKSPKNPVRFIKLLVAGSKMLIQVCPDCHTTMVNGGSVLGIKQGSGPMRERKFRRFPGDKELVWFEIQILS